jgi:type II secretion system protein I
MFLLSKAVNRGSWVGDRKGTFFHDSRTTIHNSRGFTLIEVLIAIAVLACGLVLIVEGMSRSQQAIRIAENMVYAAQLAEEKLTEYEMEVRQSHVLRSGTENGKVFQRSQGFQWEKKAEPYFDELIKEDTQLSRTGSVVAWKEGPRHNRLQMESLVLNRDKTA